MATRRTTQRKARTTPTQAAPSKPTTRPRGGKVEGTANRATRRAKPKNKSMLPVRISVDLLDRIDAIKPEHLPREPFIRYVLDIGIKTFEEEED